MNRPVLTLCAIFCALLVPVLAHAQSRIQPHTQPEAPSRDVSCPGNGPWLKPSNNQSLSASEVFQQAAAQDIVLLGEHHSNEAHHRWHLGVLEQLKAGGRPIVLALEAFPREQTEVLQAWNAGKLSGQEFVQQSGWDDFWRYPIELYLPLFEKARALGIPMYPLNASSRLVNRVRHEGWENIPLADREEIGDPARPARSYVRRLALSYRRHGRHISSDAEDQAAFKRFVQQQLLWDRAMGQSLAELKAQYPQALLVGVIGSWHLADRLGVVHQLEGIRKGLKVMQIIPWDEHIDCAEYSPGFADVVYLDPIQQ